MKFRHTIEIHPVYTCDKRQWNKDRGNDRQRHHNTIHLVGVDGQLAIPDIGSQLSVRFNHFA